MPHMNLIKRHQTSLERKANPNNSFSIEKGTRGLFKEAWEYCAELEFESSQLSCITNKNKRILFWLQDSLFIVHMDRVTAMQLAMKEADSFLWIYAYYNKANLHF